MRSTRCDDLTTETFPSARALPPDARALLARAGGVFDLPAWWDVVQAQAMPLESEAAFMTIRCGATTVAVMPMLRSGARLGGFTTPYTCSYAPLMAAGLDAAARVAVMAGFARQCRSAGLVRLDAVPVEWNGLAALEAGVRQAGLVPLRFEHFGNWFEDVGGLDWAGYLARRPGALRETVRRRLRRAEKLAEARFDLFTRPDEMAAAAEAYESVYRRSWKDAEPYPAFNVALMHAMAGIGLLRLGVWSVDRTPVAVQFWTVKDGHAIVLKLAHDEAFKAHSPGTVLTALMLRHLLDNERVRQIDFGRGDDPYKQGWAEQRRQRIGLLLANPWRPRGMATLLQHRLGELCSKPAKAQPR